MLGMNIGRHDSGVAYLNIKSPTDYSLEVFQSERLTKKKNQGDYPFVALKKFREDYPELFYALTPAQVAMNSFHSAPSKMEELYRHFPTYGEFITNFGFEKFSTLHHPEIFQPGHHISHAYSAWGFSPFEKAMVIVFDGCGSKRGDFQDYYKENDIGTSGEGPHFETLSVYLLDNGKLKPVHKEWTSFEKAVKVNHFIGGSLGNLFSLTSSRIFGNWREAGKVMGLSSYGKPFKIDSLTDFQHMIIEEPFEIYKGKEAFDNQSQESFKRSADIAASAQFYFEENFLKLCTEMKTKHSGFDNLILVGGCALNCLTNSRLLKDKYFKNVFIPPFPNDEGISIGAVLCLAHREDKIAFRKLNINKMHAYLGRSKSAEITLKQMKESFNDFKVRDWKDTPQVLADGHIVAVFQGPSEVGPRALGNRSLLVRPDLKDIKKYLNENIKFREDFRPYGATVLQEDVHHYFDVEPGFVAPFMTFAPLIRDSKESYLKGVTHHDRTSRIQTISSQQNHRFYEIISGFKALTGESVLLNTSLNIMGQPILEDLSDAISFMKDSKVNYLMINDYLLERDEKN
jgi:carbamoyltransferase